MKYKYEHELCEKFLDNISDKWDVYPEFNGWDIFLSRKEDGLQIGIQAKLRNNIYVLYQALSLTTNSWGDIREFGPDHIAVLTPFKTGDFDLVCNCCGINHLTPNVTIDMVLSHFKLKKTGCQKRYTLPEYKLISKCGVSSPRNMSKWRINALKLMVEYYNKKYVTSKDFKKFDLNSTTMTALFFKPSGEKEGKLFKYILSEEKSPIIGYEKEFEAINTPPVPPPNKAYP